MNKLDTLLSLEVAFTPPWSTVAPGMVKLSVASTVQVTPFMTRLGAEAAPEPDDNKIVFQTDPENLIPSEDRLDLASYGADQCSDQAAGFLPTRASRIS